MTSHSRYLRMNQVVLGGMMAALPIPSAIEDSMGLDGLVVGIVAPGWRIEHITVNGSAVLGVPVAGLVGTSLLVHVHPGDLAGLRAAVDRALVERANVALQLQMGHHGSWRPVRLV